MTGRFPKFGKYEIIGEVGRGGFAAVYKAVDTTLKRTVALKIPSPHLLRDPTFVQRFKREAHAAANLDHPNIVTIYEVGEIERVHFIAMRFLEGRTLSQVLEAEGPLPVSQVQAIVEQIASALDYAHAEGLIHRDVKPSNVIVADDGRVTLTDFGLVKVGEGTKLTTTGMVFGTPEYMSPEQAEGKELDARSDIYSLGVLLYEMLAGRAPFVADTTLAVMYKHVHEPPPLEELPSDLPQGVVAVVAKALAKKQEERYQSAGEMAAAFEQKVSKSVLHSSLALQLSVKPQKMDVGGKAQWTVTLRNDGDDDLRRVTVRRGQTLLHEPFDLAVGKGQRFTFTTTYKTEGKKNEEVTATGIASTGESVSDEARVTVYVTPTRGPRGLSWLALGLFGLAVVIVLVVAGVGAYLYAQQEEGEPIAMPTATEVALTATPTTAPTHTSSPVPPTDTPLPPMPTDTPPPTDTSLPPTPTDTPPPTDTLLPPTPTDTLLPPTPTDTPPPPPTDTPPLTPTDTPPPTPTDTPTPTPTATTPPPTIVSNAYWRFEEKGGTTVRDSSGNGNNGIISGATYTTDTPVLTGVANSSALLFDAEDDFVSIAAGPLTNLNKFGNGITVEAFIKPASLPIPLDRANERMMYILWADDEVYSLSLDSNDAGNTFLKGAIRCGVNPSRVADVRVKATFSNNLAGTFSHVALTFGLGELKLYINGEQVDQADGGLCGSTVGPVDTPRNVVHIGSDETAVCCDHDRDFRGVIDEVRITERPLAPTEFLGP